MNYMELGGFKITTKSKSILKMLFPNIFEINLVIESGFPSIVVNDSSDSKGIHVTKTSYTTSVQFRFFFVVLIWDLVDESSSNPYECGVASENVLPTVG